MVTYERAKKLRDLVARLPLDSILIETDAPDQPPQAHKGELNKPAYLVDVFDAVCSLRPESSGALAEQLNKNARLLFKLPTSTVTESSK